MKNTFARRLMLALVPRLYGVASRLLFATCRVRVLGEGNLARYLELASPRVVIFWHYSVFPVIALHRRRIRGWAAMVSASDDAEFVARILARQGVMPVRGSRNRRGLAALKGLLTLMAGGHDAALVGDGSQGPARVMQPGALLLASRAGAPIMPVAVAADRYWAFASWDRSILPKPFARIVLAYGEPFAVPAGLDGDGIEQWRKDAEERLNALYRMAWGECGLIEHDLVGPAGKETPAK